MTTTATVKSAIVAVQKASNGKFSSKRYVINQALAQFFTNIVINWVIRYFELRNLESIQFFGGDKSILAVFMPMAFIVPFLVTINTVKKATEHAKTDKLDFQFPDQFVWFKLALNIAVINAILNLLTTWGSVLILSMWLGESYGFNKNAVMLFAILHAGILAVVFTASTIYGLESRFAGQKSNSIVLERDRAMD